MLVREIMSHPAISIDVSEPLDSALALMAERKLTAVPVCEDEDRLVGILSEIDLLRRAVEPDQRAHFRPVVDEAPLPESVGEIMTADPQTTTESTDVADLVALFTTHSYKSLPVVRTGRLVGVVSRSDVIRALWRPDAQVQAELDAAFAEFGQQGWDLKVHHGVVDITGAGSSRERDVATAIARSVLGVRRVRVHTPD